MKKTKIAILLCAMAMCWCFMQGTVAVAAEDAGQEVVLSEGNEVIEEIPICANSLQDGYLYSAPVYIYDEALPVVRAGESWYAELKVRLANGIRNYEAYIDISDLGIPYNNGNCGTVLQDALREVLDENPDYFYVSQLSAFRHNYSTVVGVYVSYAAGFVDSNGDVDQTKIDAYNAAVSKALSHVKTGMTDVEKLLVLHDYIVLNCEYDYENLLNDTLPRSVYTAYGVMVDRVAVCNGYALAYADLVKRLGFKCYVLASATHAWNLVYVDGNWYHIDSTWADPVGKDSNNYDTEGYVSHEYFLVSDAELTALDTSSHGSWWVQNSSITVPAATKSGSYANYVFRDEALYTAMTYCNGDWYYLPNVYAGYYTNHITKSKIDGSNATVLEDLGYALFAQVEGNYLYYARCENLYTDGIYAVKLGSNTLTPERVMTMVGGKSYIDYAIDEFAVHDNIIATVLVNTKDKSKWSRLEYTTGKRETTAMPKLKIMSTQLNYPNGFSNLNSNTFPVKLVYNNGTQLAVTYNTYDLRTVTSGGGVYDITVNWRGLNATKQVSYNSEWPIEDILSTTSNYKYNAAKYVYDNGYMTGTTDTTFAPETQLKRNMVAQILYSMEGKPEVEYPGEFFSDVPEGKWYTNAVVWAYSNGLVNGYSAEKFGVSDSISRQQLASILKKYAELKGINTDAATDLSIYTDADKVKDWAISSMEWAVSTGVMSGKGDRLDPSGKTTRVQGAAMIKSFCENVISQE